MALVGLGTEEGAVPLSQTVREGVPLRGHYAYTREDSGAALQLLAIDPPAVDWLTLVSLRDTAPGIKAVIERPRSTTEVIVRMPAA